MEIRMSRTRWKNILKIKHEDIANAKSLKQTQNLRQKQPQFSRASKYNPALFVPLQQPLQNYSKKVSMTSGYIPVSFLYSPGLC